MNWRGAIDDFLHEMEADGRLRSKASIDAYYKCLCVHADDASELRQYDPRNTGRDHVKVTLRRWRHPNTQANRRSILVSFYDWLVQEGHRPYNPAAQTKRPRKVKGAVYRMTKAEARQMLLAARMIGRREERVIFMGICAGLRNAELRGMQGRHFQRTDDAGKYLWVSGDIAKGGRERWIPVIPDFEPVFDSIADDVALDHFVIPSQQVYNLEPHRPPADDPAVMASGQAVWRLVVRVATVAGIAAHIHPHLMRHAYGDHIARYAGMRNTQFLLGHADVSTTETYVGAPTLDELASSVKGFGFDIDREDDR